MTQRIFDTDNEKDMADLWDILPDNIEKIKKSINSEYFDKLYSDKGNIIVCWLDINWHDKTEITRPIQEATEADIGKLCKFWNSRLNVSCYGVLTKIHMEGDNIYYTVKMGGDYPHCRRLTKQEIEELC